MDLEGLGALKSGLAKAPLFMSARSRATAISVGVGGGIGPIPRRKAEVDGGGLDPREMRQSVITINREKDFGEKADSV